MEAYEPERHAPDYVSFLESHLKPVGSQGLKDVGLLYRTRLISLGLPVLANMVFDLSLVGLVSSVLAGLLFSTAPLGVGHRFLLGLALEGLKVIIAPPRRDRAGAGLSPGGGLANAGIAIRRAALIVAVLVAIVFVLPVRTLVRPRPEVVRLVVVSGRGRPADARGRYVIRWPEKAAPLGESVSSATASATRLAP